MRDPLIHVERNVIFTVQTIRGLIVDAVGLAPDAPKTVTTGCARRRPYAMTSADPSKVTCLACREHAASEHESQADLADAAIGAMEASEDAASDVVTLRSLVANAMEHREIATRFRRL